MKTTLKANNSKLALLGIDCRMKRSIILKNKLIFKYFILFPMLTHNIFTNESKLINKK